MPRFNAQGEPGRKITCTECHDKKAADDAAMNGGEAGQPATDAAPKRIVKRRKLVAKVSWPVHYHTSLTRNTPHTPLLGA